MRLTLSPRMKVVAAVLAVGAVMGGAWYFVGPRIARASQQGQGELAGLKKQLADTAAQYKKAQTQLARLQEQAQTAAKQSDDLAAETDTALAAKAEADKTLAELTKKLETANTANEPMRQKLAFTETALTDALAKAEQAKAKETALTGALKTAGDERQALTQTRAQLQTANAELGKSLAAQEQRAGQLTRLLALLKVGSADAAAESATVGAAAAGKPAPPAEPPITACESAQWLGNPTLVFQKNNEAHLAWGKQHAAVAVDGILTELDGKPATRALLASAATTRLAAPAAPGTWRYGSGQSVQYADLVDLFGPPDRVCGTGAQFTATWAVGAWARAATAKVVHGVVTEFDGRPPDAAVCCELVRQRPAAYAAADKPVRAEAATAEACYKAATAAVGEALAKEVRVMSRDGLTLSHWALAGLDSVGTWVGPARAPAGAYTVRGTLDCTYTRADGTATPVRRNVIVTVLVKTEGKSEVMPTLDFVMCSPRG